MSNKKIKIISQGPYLVSKDIPLKQAVIVPDANGTAKEWAEGKNYDISNPDAPYCLCRCGHSKDKPFCDGSHTSVGFEGTERANHRPYDEDAEYYKGEDLILKDKEPLCAIARFCDKGEGVWRLAMRSGDPENKQAAIQMALDCPSGRLTVTEKDGTEIEPYLEQEIAAIEDVGKNCRGPLWVKGGISVESADGAEYEVRNRVTLCRCGKSNNKPFCDASHLPSGYQDGHLK